MKSLKKHLTSVLSDSPTEEIRELLVIKQELQKITPAEDWRGILIDAKYIDEYFNFHKERFLGIIETVEGLFTSSKGRKILDIGTAYGFYSKVLKKKGYEVTGIELPEHKNAYKIETSRSRGIHMVFCDITRGIPLSSKGFDVVILSEVLEHLNKNPRDILKDIRRVLKKNGILILSTPNVASISNITKLLSGRNIVDPFPENKSKRRGHVREYTKTELSNLLVSCGYEIVTVRMETWWDKLNLKKITDSNVVGLVAVFLQFFIALILPRYRSSMLFVSRKKN